MISELFLPDLLLVKKQGSLQDQNDFFTALYLRQNNWKQTYPEETYLGNLSVDRHTGSEKVKSFPMNSASWVEFEQFVDTAYGIALFLTGWKTYLNADDYTYYLERAGVYERPAGLTTLTASDGTVLAHSLVTPQNWADGWNSLRVPYERNTLGNTTFPYIKNLDLVGEDPAYFRQNVYQFP